MKKIISACLIIFFGHCCIAQSEGPITVKENFWKGTVYFQNDQAISKRDVRLKLSEDKLLLDQFNGGHSSQVFGTVLAGIGGFLIGYPLGQSLGDRDANWNLAIYGGVSVILGSVLYSSGKKKIVSALNGYNSGLAIYNIPGNKKSQDVSYFLAPGSFVVNF